MTADDEHPGVGGDDHAQDEKDYPASVAEELKQLRAAIAQAACEQQHDRTDQANKTELFHRRIVSLEIATLIFVVGALVVYGFQLRAMREQVRLSQDQLVASQRPVVSFGDRDGALAQYLAPSDGHNKGAIVLYFQNSGPTAAPSFGVSATASWPPGASSLELTEPATYRALVSIANEGGGLQTSRSTTISPRGSQIALLDDRYVPSPEHWSLLRDGSLEGYEYRIVGLAQWCEGTRVRCFTFAARYLPPPIDGFVADTPPPLQRCLYDPPANIQTGKVYHVEPLYPCTDSQTRNDKERERTKRAELLRKEGLEPDATPE